MVFSSRILFFGLLSLFMILLTFALTKRTGSPCGRGWMALMILPVVAAAGWNLLMSVMGPKTSENPYVSMVAFTTVLVLLEYALSVVLIKRHKPTTSWSQALKHGLVTALFVVIPAVLAITYYFALTQAAPKVRSIIWRFISGVPFVQQRFSSKTHWLTAWGIGAGVLLIPLSLIPVLGAIIVGLANYLPMTPLMAALGHRIACWTA